MRWNVDVRIEFDTTTMVSLAGKSKLSLRLRLDNNLVYQCYATFM